MEVQLRRPDQTLAQVPLERREQEDHITRFQQRHPVARGRVGNAGVGAERGEVQQLSHATGGESDEAFECDPVADLSQPAHIALHIGLEVVGERPARFEAPVMDPRIAAGVEDLVGVRPAAGRPALRQRERQQPENRGAPGERLADRVGEAELLAAGEHEPAVPPLLVGQRLEPGQQFRSPLDLVEDGALLQPGEEPARVGLDEAPLVGSVEVYVPEGGERRPAEGGLPRLPRPGDRGEGVASELLDQVRGEFPGDQAVGLSGLHDLKVAVSDRTPPPRGAPGDYSAAVRSRSQRRMRSSRTGRVTGPLSRTRSWKSRTSKSSPNSDSASARSSRIFNSPIL